jgi:hypothetical protein
MSSDERPPGTSLVRPDRAAMARVHEARERAIGVLSDGFANDALDVEEFERRVTLAHTSEAVEEIDALIADLPAPAETALAKPVVTLAPASADDRAPAETVYAIFGGVDRRGAWTVPRRWRVVAIMGGGLLDLREARFPTGVIDLEVKAVFGGVQIIVPPGLAVEVSGTAIMGGFQNVNRAPAHPDPDAPLLRIRGVAIMGGVDITMRLPGESEHQAHRRQRLESHRERHALRDQRRNEKRALREAQRAERRAQRLLDRPGRHDG